LFLLLLLYTWAAVVALEKLYSRWATDPLLVYLLGHMLEKAENPCFKPFAALLNRVFFSSARTLPRSRFQVDIARPAIWTISAATQRPFGWSPNNWSHRVREVSRRSRKLEVREQWWLRIPTAMNWIAPSRLLPTWPHAFVYDIDFLRNLGRVFLYSRKSITSEWLVQLFAITTS